MTVVEIIAAANSLTWPGAIALLGGCAAVVGVAFAWAWMVRG